MTLGEIYAVIPDLLKARVSIFESDMTDTSGAWRGCPPELADRKVKKVYPGNNRSDLTYDYGDFVIHIFPEGKSA